MSQTEQLRSCRISSWYPSFKAVSFKTAIFNVEQSTVDYLVEDGVHLPADSQALGARLKEEYADGEEWDTDSSDSAGQLQSEPQNAALTELKAKMREAVASLGGVVAPKFTWSCPKDAVWLTLDHSLACRNPEEVLLLLKSSDRVAYDIDQAQQAFPVQQPASRACLESRVATGKLEVIGSCAGSGLEGGTGASRRDAGWGEAGKQLGGGDCKESIAGLQHAVALRKWHDLRPEREFRCFVRDHHIVGISQREITEFFPSLIADKGGIQARILEFHRRHIQGRFPLPHYAYDVYVAATADAVKLVDFNPIGGATSPLLFSWEELPFSDVLQQLDGEGRPHTMGDLEGTAQPAKAGRSQRGQQEQQAQQGQQAQHAGSQEHQAPAGSDSSCAGCCSGDAPTGGATCEFRIVTEPVAMRPNKAAYGVPFDFVDASEGSALNQLMKQLGGQGPEDLWAALSSTAS